MRAEVLLSGLGIPESPRWHEGRLWFCNWVDRQVVAVGLDSSRDMLPSPSEFPMGYSIDWLPDGRRLVTRDKVWRWEPDGTMAVHARERDRRGRARQRLRQRCGLQFPGW